MLWKDRLAKDYADQSPIKYVDKIVTPTLILADSGDQRVPTAQSFVLFNALKERGIETKFVLYPANSHFPSDPVQGEEMSCDESATGWICTESSGLRRSFLANHRRVLRRFRYSAKPTSPSPRLSVEGSGVGFALFSATFPR